MVTWWFLNINEVLSQTHSSLQGLSQSEAETRLRSSGLNIIHREKNRTVWNIFLAQLKNWLILILLFAAAVSFALGDHIESLVIFSIVLLSVFFSFFQEYRAENILSKIKKYITHRSRVLRDGIWRDIESSHLVIGDLVSLRVGDRAAAEMRLVTSDGLSLDESILTGESLPSEKTVSVLVGASLPVPDQKNMVFAGSYVASGMGTGVVVATGSQTFLGQTAAQIQASSAPTDFQKQIQNFSGFLMKIVVIMTLFVFVSNSLLHKGIFESFVFALALAVGITPELLPMIITVTLSQGAVKMAKAKVVVKKLATVEDFGNMDTLCTDKTGTLTTGEFKLTEFRNLAGDQDQEVLLLALLCSSGFTHDGSVATTPMDTSLWASPEVKLVRPQMKSFRLTDENEFDFTRRLLSVVVKKADQYQLIVKGAADSVLSRCVNISNTNLLSQVISWEQQGNRVLAVASKTISVPQTDPSAEKNLSFKGFLLFTDEVKASAKESLDLFKKLGVNVKVISGDSPAIVFQVSQQVGLARPGDKVIIGSDLAGLSAQKISDIAFKYHLFARVTPQQKYVLVQALNQEGHIVGFLGDGVNDAPALKASDIGIAVDTGSEVAKEAADIVLLKKDLRILAEGIEQGRKTFGNITKYILNTISANYGNMITVALSSLFLPFIPLLPAQILLNNFLSDIPMLAIATDNVDPNFIKKPKRWDIRLIGRFMIYFGLISSLFDLATILPLIYIWHVSPEVFRTAWFVESSLSEILITFAIRTHLPLLKSLPSRSLIILSLLSAAAILTLPFILLSQSLFSFAVLPVFILAWIALVLVAYLFVVEFAKTRFFAKFDL